MVSYVKHECEQRADAVVKAGLRAGVLLICSLGPREGTHLDAAHSGQGMGAREFVEDF